MSIPIILLCGTQPSQHARRIEDERCPICHQETLALVESRQRFCFCFIPCCFIGSPTTYRSCAFCGSKMPAVAFETISSSSSTTTSRHENVETRSPLLVVD